MLAIPCTLTALAEIYATHRPQSRFAEYRIEVAEPEHTHAEQDTGMLAYAFFDVHSPTITGGEIPSRQSQELLAAVNEGIAQWWAGTALGHRFVVGELLRDVRASGRRLTKC